MRYNWNTLPSSIENGPGMDPSPLQGTSLGPCWPGRFETQDQEHHGSEWLGISSQLSWEFSIKVQPGRKHFRIQQTHAACHPANSRRPCMTLQNRGWRTAFSQSLFAGGMTSKWDSAVFDNNDAVFVLRMCRLLMWVCQLTWCYVPRQLVMYSYKVQNETWMSISASDASYQRMGSNKNSNNTEKNGLHMGQPVKKDVEHDTWPFPAFPTSRWRCHWSLVRASETEDAAGRFVHTSWRVELGRGFRFNQYVNTYIYIHIGTPQVNLVNCHRWGN